MTVVPEPYSNAVVVMASAANLPRVQDLIAKLDNEAPSAGLRTESAVLKKTPWPPDLADVLRGIVPGRPTPGKPGVAISADAASNTLLISGPADQVAKMVETANQDRSRHRRTPVQRRPRWSSP